MSRAAALLLHAPLAALIAVILLGGCATAPPPARPEVGAAPRLAVSERDKAAEVVMFSLGLLDVGYRFGGRNPEAGLDCSGMVSFIYERVTGLRLPHNAAEIARRTRPIERAALRPGDLVFFNTLDSPYSHVGIFIGGDRFVHAPSSGGRVRADRLSDRYYARRFEGGRTLFED